MNLEPLMLYYPVERFNSKYVLVFATPFRVAYVFFREHASFEMVDFNLTEVPEAVIWRDEAWDIAEIMRWLEAIAAEGEAEAALVAAAPLAAEAPAKIQVSRQLAKWLEAEHSELPPDFEVVND